MEPAATWRPRQQPGSPAGAQLSASGISFWDPKKHFPQEMAMRNENAVQNGDMRGWWAFLTDDRGIGAAEMRI